MSSLTRKIRRQKAKTKGDFIYKKKLAKKMGVSLNELNNRLMQRKKNLEKINGGE